MKGDDGGWHGSLLPFHHEGVFSDVYSSELLQPIIDFIGQ